ncbi:MAG: STAS domain-containing protein [candidate division Zixibacteria bacterium]|nr:STAS domain-containing protein [candidate division Zixibacteria bacterium]
MENIQISLSETDSDRQVSHVRVDGVIDTLTASELEEVIDSLLKRHRYRIVIDLAGVDYISSAGWGIFISHIRDVRANNGDIKLSGMVSDVYEIFQLLEFDNILQAFASVDEATRSFPVAESGDGLKKKGSEVTRYRVLTGAVPESDFSPSEDSPLFVGPAGVTGIDVESAVLQMVRRDPFATISEIVFETNRRQADQQVGWWQVFGMLRRHRLLRRRSRFRYAWRRG